MKPILCLFFLSSFKWMNAISGQEWRYDEPAAEHHDAVQFKDRIQIPSGSQRPQSQRRSSVPFISPDETIQQQSDTKETSSLLEKSAEVFDEELANVCGRPGEASKSIGGEISPEGKYPWVAALVYFDENNKTRLSCSGVLISRDLVLTTAECIKKTAGIPDEIRVGTTRLDKNKKGGQAHNTLFGLSSKTYDRRQLKDNVALVILEDSVDFNAEVQPICIPGPHNARTPNVLSRAETAAWKFSKGQGGELLRFESQIVDGPRCLHLSKNGQIDTNEICVVFRGSAGRACQDDIGAPLMIESEGQNYVFGILSRADPCGTDEETTETAALFERISPHYDWIEETRKKLEETW